VAAKGIATFNVLFLKCTACRSGQLGRDCHECCACPSAFRPGRGFAVKGPDIRLPPMPSLAPAPPMPPTAIIDPEVDPEEPPPRIRPINPGGAPMSEVPPSPYDVPNDACSGSEIKVRGFPSSPFAIRPFVNDFQNPPAAQKRMSHCTTAAGGACIDVYEIDVVEMDIDLKTGCSGGLTRVVSAGGRKLLLTTST
jgi:hypothetical protein